MRSLAAGVHKVRQSLTDTPPVTGLRVAPESGSHLLTLAVGVPTQTGAADVKISVGHAFENLLRRGGPVKLAVGALLGA